MNESCRQVGLDRRRLIAGAAGTLGAVGALSLMRPSSAVGATLGRADEDDHEVVPAPKPIPNPLQIGLAEPYDVIHVHTPGPPGQILPFTRVPLEGLDSEPSTVTDFRGDVALAYVVGTATGSDDERYDLEVDIRAFEGEYEPVQGPRERGLFALI